MLNPLAARWNLVCRPSVYYRSSDRFYKMGIKVVDYLKDMRKEF